MNEKTKTGNIDFIPLTGRLGISGTSYMIQLGIINNKWASVLLRGKKCIAFNTYSEDYRDMPNINHIINWILNTIPVPNINPQHIRKTIQILIKQAMKNKEKKRELIPIKETKSVKLETIPHSELKRPETKGWVKNSVDIKQICNNINKLREQIDHINAENLSDEILKVLESFKNKLHETSNCICRGF
ncbi:hypothetical protein ES706_04109 [subsurface metagenome]